MMREGCAILQKPARNAGRLPGFWWAWLVPALMAGTTLGCLADEAPTAGSGSQVSEAENGSTPAPTAIRTETRIPTQSGATLVVTPAAPATTMPVESPLAPVPRRLALPDQCGGIIPD